MMNKIKTALISVSDKKKSKTTPKFFKKKQYKNY